VQDIACHSRRGSMRKIVMSAAASFIFARRARAHFPKFPSKYTHTHTHAHTHVSVYVHIRDGTQRPTIRKLWPRRWPLWRSIMRVSGRAFPIIRHRGENYASSGRRQEASRIEINGADVILPHPRMDTLALRFLFETRDLRPAVRQVLRRYPSP